MSTETVPPVGGLIPVPPSKSMTVNCHGVSAETYEAYRDLHECVEQTDTERTVTWIEWRDDKVRFIVFKPAVVTAETA